MTTSRPLVLAVPSKGRMQENAAGFFARAGLTLQQGRGARDYRGTLAGFDDVEVAYLPVADIVSQLAEGAVHLGVAGEDLLREQVADAGARVALLSKLGFGNANVVVAVPQAWIDVRGTADLEDVAAVFHARRGRRMRVATKYINLTRAFLSSRGVTDYRIVESLGATEGAPASGTAEFIVDITTTGATLTANGLKVLDDGVMLRSEANLMASLTAPWSDATLAAARMILARIAAEEAARLSREVRAQFEAGAPDLGPEAAARFAAERFPSGSPDLQIFHCAAGQVGPLSDWLVERGAGKVIVAPMDYIFAAANPLFDSLVGRLPSGGRSEPVP
ncbi:ATP phosphoribosyltransferase [Lichenihabitans sp. Uapishka_5]|uniref:ATP phosphoribosyltransferase n=1 Tax=Lichenihabitans sp. Uapishka_5 TaxID=3037302 RepID=UPI0029E80110|nr:ATP phosphoribosyltransferase [Lichenihabitans sp. Uapishka_5]MDX7949871.1 ATP phosphoribosyltransferase [Lichenihabitans sp. Uapishka_5]